MRSFFKIFIGLSIICSLIKQVLSGQIYGTDIQVQYPIANQATVYTFNILLETLLPSGFYLRIKWPYQIDYLNGNTDVTIKIQDVKLANPALTATALTTQDYIYHFSFSTNLLPYTWYTVQLTGVVNLENLQTTGFQSPVQIATVVSTVSNTITIDQNQAFGVFALGSTPPSTATITASVLSGQTSAQNAPGGSYIISLTLTTTQNVSSYDSSNPSGVQYQLAMTDPSFQFVNPTTCIIANRATGICTCSYLNSNKAILLISCTQDLIVSNTSPIQLQVTVVNSMKMVSSTQGFNLSVIYPPTQLLVETGSLTNFFSVSFIAINNMSLKLMHRIPYTTSFLSNYQVPLGIYIPSTINPKFQPYNSVTITFQVPSIISNTNGGLVIQVSFTSAESILESSITHNFPLFSATVPVRCSFNFQLQIIQCIGIGQLAANTNYYIGCRVALTYKPTLTTDVNGNLFISNFGGIQVLAVMQDSSGVTYYGAITDINYPVNSINVYQNAEFIDNAGGTGAHNQPNFGYNIAVSGLSVASVPNIANAFQNNLQNGANIGIFPSAASARLLFYIGVTQMQQTYQDYLGYRQQTYMKLVYNDNVIQMLPSDLPKGIEVNTPIASTYYGNYDTASSDNQIIQQQDLSGNNLFKYAYLKINTQTALFSANKQGFSLSNVFYPASFKCSQFVADDRVLDFLLTFMYLDNTRGSSSTNKLLPHSTMLFNGYTITSTYLPDTYEVAFTNIYTKGQDYNKGLKIPTLLRIYGQITISQMGLSSATGYKIAIIPDRSVQRFFAVNQFYVTQGVSPNEGCGGTSSFCYSYDDGQSSKISSPTDNWVLNPFIVLDLPDASVQITAAIALALKASQQPNTLNIAIFQYLSNGQIEVVAAFRMYGSSLGLTNFITNTRFYQTIIGAFTSTNAWDQTSNYSENSGAITSVYKLSNINSIKPSTAVSNIIFYSQHVDGAHTITMNNAASLYYGAGFTISSYNQDLIGTGSITAFPAVSSLAKCIQKFKYKTYLMDVPYYNYIIHCPFDSASYTDGTANQGVTFNSITFPSQWGANYPLLNKFAYGWSNNKGQFIEMLQESQTIPATQYATGCTATTWTPQYLQNTDKQQMTMTITPSIQATLTSITDFYTVTLIFVALPPKMSFLQQCIVQTVSTPNSNISSGYTTCSAKLKSASKQVTFTIQKSNDDGVPISFASTQAFTLNFVIGFLSATSANQSFDVYLGLNSYTQDKCTNGGAITLVGATAAPAAPASSLTISNFVCTTPTMSSNSNCSWKFNYNGRQSIPNTTIRFILGFMATPRMFTNLDCQVLESQSYHNYFPEGTDSGLVTGYMPSTKFSQITYNTAVNSIDIVFGGTYTNPTLPFLINCYGFKTPNGINNNVLSVQWVDTTANQNTVISSSITNINFYSYTFYTAKTLSSSNLKLISKILSAPGFEAIYTIQFTPQNVRMVSKSRIYVEFSVGYKQVLNSKGYNPQCQLNGNQVACLRDQTNVRRLIIYPLYGIQSTLEPQNTYTLIISGILQPQTLDSYGYIWFGIDADDNLQNGLQEQGDIKDSQVQQIKITYLSQASYQFSSLKIRQPRVMMSFNFTCAARTITSSTIALIKLHPAFFNSVETDFECTFFRQGDSLRTNLTSTCERIYGNSIIRMNLTGDSYNSNSAASYWVEVFYLPSPDYDNLASNPIFQNFFLTDSTMTTILYAMAPSLSQSSIPVSFYTASNTTKQIMWYQYNQNLVNPSANAIQTVYNQYSGRDREVAITVYRGIITNNVIYMTFLAPNSYFDIDYSFYYVNSTAFNLFDVYMGKQSLSTSSVRINTGDLGISLAIAGSASTPLGTYTLALYKSGLFQPFEDPEISPLPNLILNVQDTICNIALSSTTLSIPVGTISTPIVLDFSTCIPSQPLTVIGTISSGTTTDISFYSQSSQIVGYLYQSQAIFYFQANGSLQTPYLTYKVTFTLQGGSQKQFAIASNVLTISIAAQPTFATIALTGYAQALSTDQSTMVITGQCNQSGFVYWAVALNEFYLNSSLFFVNIDSTQIISATAYQSPSNTVSLQNILTDMRYRSFYWVGTPLNFIDQNLARYYGVSTVTSGTPFTLTLQNLPQRSEYSFIAYCYSSIGDTSKAQTGSWATSWRLDNTGTALYSYNHLQIDLTFNAALTQGQLNNIQCQLQQSLAINVYSLSTSNCTLCNQAANYTISNLANFQDLNFNPTTCTAKALSTPSFVYTFYAWSGEQSNGSIIDLSKVIQAKLTANSCYFLQILNYSYDQDIITNYANIYKVTPIAPQPSTNLQPEIDLLSIVNTKTNMTLELSNSNAPGFLIVAAHHFNSTNSSSTKSSNGLTLISLQPSSLNLRQRIFGDNTTMNYYYNITPITAGQKINTTINFTLNQEYAVYWTVASYDSCADSFYAPMGFKQFIFEGLGVNFISIIQTLNWLILILTLIL